MESQGIDWRAVGRALSAPFPAAEVEWRVQGKGAPNARAQVVAYVSARMVQERLDEVVGVGGWTFEWQPINVDAKGEVTTAKGVLTVLGIVKSDVGTASNFEASKGCVSNALKRAAVMFGIARYLYSLPAVWVALDDNGKIPETMKAKLAQGLERHAAKLAVVA